MFVDQAKIKVTAGRGGNGCASFRKEKFVDKGGPDGGKGGHGGDVLLRCDENLSTLLDFQFKSQFKAESGVHGKGKNKDGRSGDPLVINVPPGTVIKSLSDGKELADLVKHGQTYLAAKGGRGGRGNTSFKSSTNRAPREAEEGGEGEHAELLLELKLIADVGIIGCPNAGKSSLISRISNATPRIAGYPFTTIEPKVGVVRMGESSFVAAEIPGLIEGAHEGKGLGDRFLRHIERTRYIVHLVDLSVDPANDFRVVRNELDSRGYTIPEERYIVAANKIDITGAADNLPGLADAAGSRKKLFMISCVSGKGVDALIKHLAERIYEDKQNAGG